MAETDPLDTPLIGGDNATQTLNGAGESPPAAKESSSADAPESQADASATGEKAESKEQEVDYKAELAATQEKLAKAEGDLRSLQTGRTRNAERDAKMDRMALAVEGLQDSQLAQEKGQTALIKALSSGDTEGLPAELETITQDSQAQRTTSQLRAQAQSLVDDLLSIGTDDGNTVKVDIGTDERFADVRAVWAKISGDASLQGPVKLGQLASVIPLAAKVMMGIERDQSSKTLDEAKNAGEVGRKKALEESNLLDTDSVSRTGAVDGSVQALIQKSGRGQRLTKAEQTRLNEHLDDGLDDTPGSVLSASLGA